MTALVLIILIIILEAFKSAPPPALQGAWKLEGPGDEVIVVADNYLSHTAYNLANKQFNYTRGGSFNESNGKIALKLDYHSKNKDAVGQTVSVSVKISGDRLETGFEGAKQTWRRIDDGKGALAGTWRINGRKQGDQIVEMKPGARRTLKILSGTRFQWMAINSETGEFRGTGGGTYSFKDGKYTEHIEFFSRDGGRVGASLSFDGKVSGGQWIHSGNSSAGEPIYETWIKYQP